MAYKDFLEAEFERARLALPWLGPDGAGGGAWPNNLHTLLDAFESSFLFARRVSVVKEASHPHASEGLATLQKDLQSRGQKIDIPLGVFIAGVYAAGADVSRERSMKGNEWLADPTVGLSREILQRIEGRIRNQQKAAAQAAKRAEEAAAGKRAILASSNEQAANP